MGREEHNYGVGRFIHLYEISVCAVQVKYENLFSRRTRTSYMLIEEMPLSIKCSAFRSKQVVNMI